MDAPVKQTVLVVDDTSDNLTLMTSLLKEAYHVKIATNGRKALALAASGQDPPSMILLDIMMPEMDGYEVCRRLKQDPRTAEIPVIFLTAKAEVEDEKTGLEIGAVDYITKPISPPIVMARIKNHLLLKNASDFLKDKNAYLEEEVARRTREIAVVQDVTIMAMASLAEARDNETGNHIRRTQHYVKLMADRMKGHPKYAGYLDSETIQLIFKSAPLHDIGKVGIPDRILLKPGRLTPDEFEIMKDHARIGRDTIQAAESLLNAPSSFLRFAREVAYSHHEKWDGSGYPLGMKGDDIPACARIMAFADVYDALISRRVYKPPLPHEEAIAIIREGKGSHFDPEMVDGFLEVSGNFREVALQFSDP
ncbi:MAG: two-component system response regulator [Myxococcota bacterium]|jgi:putative two-component system response regulator